MSKRGLQGVRRENYMELEREQTYLTIGEFKAQRGPYVVLNGLIGSNMRQYGAIGGICGTWNGYFGTF